MKKYLAVIAVLIVLTFAVSCFAEEVYAPGINNSGQIGTSSRVWRNGYFQNLYISGGTLTSPTIVSPVITAPNITTVIASHDFSSSTADWVLSATEKTAKIVLIRAPAAGPANIIAPSEVRTYYVVNQSTAVSGDMTIKASGGTGIVIKSGRNSAIVGFITGDYVRITPNTSYGS